MPAIALVLASLACAGHARRATITSEQIQHGTKISTHLLGELEQSESHTQAAVSTPLKMLAMLLLTFDNQAAAFSGHSAGIHGISTHTLAVNNANGIRTASSSAVRMMPSDNVDEMVDQLGRFLVPAENYARDVDGGKSLTSQLNEWARAPARLYDRPLELPTGLLDGNVLDSGGATKVIEPFNFDPLHVLQDNKELHQEVASIWSYLNEMVAIGKELKTSMPPLERAALKQVADDLCAQIHDSLLHMWQMGAFVLPFLPMP